jgi:hypothetical protein
MYNPEKNVSLLNCKYKDYQVGSMENTAKNDEGIGWRRTLTPELESRGIFSFDPTREEIKKVGKNTKKFLKAVKKYQSEIEQETFREKFLDSMDRIWLGVDKLIKNPETKEIEMYHIFGDFDYVTNSDFLIWHYEEGDKPGGTYLELACAYFHKIPVYLVSLVEPEVFNTSIYWCQQSTGNREGKHFKDFSTLLQFLDTKYNLTVKK